SPDITGEAQAAERAPVSWSQSVHFAQRDALAVACPEGAQKADAVLETRGHDESALRGQPPDEQAERGQAAHTSAKVAGSHAQLVQVGEQKPADPLRCHLSFLPHVSRDLGQAPAGPATQADWTADSILRRSAGEHYC